MPYLVFALIAILFGSNFILIDRASAVYDALDIAAWRVCGAAAVMFLAWLVSRPLARVARKDLPGIATVGMVSNAYPYAVMPWIIAQGVPHSFLAMFVAFTPLLTIVLSVPMLGVWPTARQVVGVVGGLSMLALVFLDGQQRQIDPWLLLLAVTVPIGYATGNTLIRRSLQHVPGIPLSGLLSAFAATVMLPLALVGPKLGSTAQAAAANPASGHQAMWIAVGAVLWMGVVGTGISNWLFVRLIQRQGPLFAGMITYAVPLVGLFWGLVDGQQITDRQLIAIAGVLSMVALVQYGAAKPQVDSGDG